MKRLLVCMTVAIMLLSCSKPEEFVSVQAKPSIDTVHVTYFNVNTVPGYYTYEIRFDKPLQHNATLIVKWTSMLTGNIPVDHVHQFTTTKAITQTVVTNVAVEKQFVSITRTTNSPLDTIWANNTHFIY